MHALVQMAPDLAGVLMAPARATIPAMAVAIATQAPSRSAVGPEPFSRCRVTSMAMSVPPVKMFVVMVCGANQ